jgi:hypothetical protein
VQHTVRVTSYEEFEPDEPRGWSPLAVALIATLVLLLGLGGALFGINVADHNKKANAGTLPESVATLPVDTTTPASTPSSPATTTPSATPTAGTPTSAPATDAFALPPLSGMDFQLARAKVRDLKLGWTLVFEGAGTDTSVHTTDPAAGTQVHRGDTVKIYVRGLAPVAILPAVVGLTCEKAAGMIVDAGLYPTYPTGRTGTVKVQDPSATTASLPHWNDQVSISCG